jgi:predicted permease
VDAHLESMMQQVEQRVGSLPGVHGASFAFSLFGGGWTDPVTVPGRLKSGNDPDVFQNIVGPDYLDVMRTSVVLGRALSLQDHSASQKVAVINETMARTYFPGGSPLGRTFSVGDNPEWQNIEVVGVAKDAKYMSLKQRSMPAAFYPHSQHGMFLYVLVTHCTDNPKLVIPQIRRAVHAIDPHLPVSDAATLQQVVEDSVLNQRLVAQLSTIFGLLATLLSCVGIYGVVSYGITRRMNEFGIRMALGAEHTDVLWTVIREALRLVLTGVALGLVLAIACGRLVQSQLFGLESYDPLALCVALVAMISISLAASYLPARRATRIDPMVALRYE